MVNTPVFTSVIFSIILLMLPNYTPDLINAALITVICLGFFVPFIFGKNILAVATIFSQKIHPFGKKFLSLHGIIFLAVFQIFALLCSLDFLFSNFTGESHSIVLIPAIVLSGLISLMGATKLINAIATIASISLIAGLGVVLINQLFIHSPLFDILNPTMFHTMINSSAVDIFHGNVVVAVIALSSIIFWLMWLEPSELHRKTMIEQSSLLKRSAIVSGLFLIGVFILFAKDAGSSSADTSVGSTILISLISLFLIGGIMGLFVTTFHAIGSLFAYDVYPQFQHVIHLEKQILIEKLSTVFSVIMTILLIPVVRSAGGDVIIWYIYFLGTFSPPIVVSFFIFAFWKRKSSAALTASILIGEMYAVSELIAYTWFETTLLVGASSIFTVSTASAVVTLLSFGILDAALGLGYSRRARL